MNLDFLIKKLLEDRDKHEKVGPKLKNHEIEKIEQEINLILPNSYKTFLKEFGDGAYWVYAQAIDTISTKPYWLNSFRKELGTKIKLEGTKEIKVETLLCLMTEDANGGAWCWLTEEECLNGEWSLAYYSRSDNQLHYKVENFTKWLKILLDSKYEVIAELDVEDKLGLG